MMPSWLVDLPPAPRATPLEANGLRPLRHTTWVTAFFLVAVLGVMLVQHGRTSADDLLRSREMTALKTQLAAAPRDEAIKQQIRELDLSVRRHYFRRLALDAAGAWLLLAGAIAFVTTAKAVAWRRRQPPMPHLPVDPEESMARAQRHARLGTGIVGAAAGVTLLGLSWGGTSALPSRQADVEQGLAGRAASTGPAADRAASLADLQKNWPRFQGWDGRGFAPQADVPAHWNLETGENLAWRSNVPAPGFGSPVVWEGQVFLSGGDAARREVFCFDASTGELRWRRAVENVPGSPAKPPEIPDSTGFAAATMATDGARVYAIFANGDLAAFSLDGALVWARNLGVPKNPYGHASSLTTWQGRLFVQWDQGEAEQSLSRLYAMDGVTGREAWQRTRPVSASWATPVVVEAAGKPQLLTVSVPWLIAYAPANGQELWRAGEFEGEVTSSPVGAAGLVFAISPNIALSAFRPDGAGDVSATHRAWSAEDNVPDITTPASNGELLFTLSSSGVLTCYDARTGARQWEHDFATECLASPGIAGGKLFVLARSGAAFVVAAARDFNELGRADFGEEVLASPAFAADRMFVRGAAHLFCMQAGQSAPGEVASATRGRGPI